MKIKGHAIELRVYAEDPTDDFMPSVGLLEKYKAPKGEGIRVDDGFEEGMEVPIYYDPMISKLVTYDDNREAAIQKMISAIDAYEVEGVATTLPFGKFVCQHEAFRSGHFDTHFVKHHYTPEILEEEQKDEAKLAAMIALRAYLKDQNQLRIPETKAE